MLPSWKAILYESGKGLASWLSTVPFTSLVISHVEIVDAYQFVLQMHC